MSIQRSLFEFTAPAPPPPTPPSSKPRRIATVQVRRQRLQELDYLVPDELRDAVSPGCRVRVPLGHGNRLVEAYCVRVEDRAADRPLKAVADVLDSRGLLDPKMLRLTRWIADYYLCEHHAVLETAVPAGVRQRAGTRPAVLLRLADDAARQAAAMKLTAKQQAVLAALAEGPLAADALARQAGCGTGPIQKLRSLGLIAAEKTRVPTAVRAAEAPQARQSHLQLNASQREALAAVEDAMAGNPPSTILLHGVTGSGKTEVYIQAIAKVVSAGRQAIVLVPEISLTPQTVERFRSRFGEVAVLHSHLSDAERHHHWQQIARGDVAVVVGARSAVFAPTPRLGLIVLDEEHESSFKQDSAPRYHARDVALARARAEGIPLVLGSATPSLESWRNAQLGTYRLIAMPHRVEARPLPHVGTIDLRLEKSASRGALSRRLSQAITAALDDGGQVILLLNRRGFATHIQCPACGFALRCPHCDIALTHHRTNHTALCHYCDYQVPAPPVCPQCHFGGIRYSGVGTQKLEAEVRARFPQAAVLRMDTDSMQAPGAHSKALAAFRRGDVRILLGTQMIAKGLDFPNVTLVGVINADTALHLPDFRAAERTFQLVTQVAGRTGRGPKGGRVLVQTFSPDHPAIAAATQHDYAAFAAGELPLRQALGYPPFGSMVRIVVRGENGAAALACAEGIAQHVRASLGGAAGTAAGVRVLGPAPAPFARLRGMYRFQIHLHGPEAHTLREAVANARRSVESPEGVQWIADIDPIDML